MKLAFVLALAAVLAGCEVSPQIAVSCVAACGASGVKSVRWKECICNEPASRVCPTDKPIGTAP